MQSKVVRSPSRYMLDIGLSVADSAILGGLRIGGYLYALFTKIAKEEAAKLQEAEAQATERI